MAALHPLGPWREDESLSAGLRDELTRSWLAGAVSSLVGVEIVEFDNDWWNGGTYGPCLVVRGGRRHRLLRVVEDAGEAVVVPFERKRAQRSLARRHRELPAGAVPQQRAADDTVALDASVDVVRCSGEGCGALLPIGYPGSCPVCGCGD